MSGKGMLNTPAAAPTKPEPYAAAHGPAHKGSLRLSRAASDQLAEDEHADYLVYRASTTKMSHCFRKASLVSSYRRAALLWKMEQLVELCEAADIKNVDCPWLEAHPWTLTNPSCDLSHPSAWCNKRDFACPLCTNSIAEAVAALQLGAPAASNWAMSPISSRSTPTSNAIDVVLTSPNIKVDAPGGPEKLTSSAADTVPLFMDTILRMDPSATPATHELHLRIGATEDARKRLSEHARGGYLSAMILGTAHGSRLKARGLQKNAERYVRNGAPSEVAGFVLHIDNRKNNDGATIETRVHSDFCLMSPDIKQKSTMHAVEIMRVTPVAEWSDEGISVRNFWWTLINVDALSIYLLGSLTPIVEAPQKKSKRK